MDSATLELLWARFLDGDELDPAEEALLADALDDNPSMRDRFLRDHDIDAALQWLPRTHLGGPAFAGGVMQKWNASPAAESAMETHQPMRSAHGSRWYVRWLPTAVAATLLVGAIGVVWKGERREVVASLGTLAPAENAKWDGDRPTQLTAEPMRLTSGTVQMLLASGVQLTADGPAEWRIQSNDRLLAQRGNFRAVIPRKAVGFTVQTPTAVIVDLGTEFEFDVDADGATNVKVERGTVEVSTIPRGGVLSKRRRLGAGEHGKVDRHGDMDDAPKQSEPQVKFRGAVAEGGQVREFDDEGAFQKALTDARNAPVKKPMEVQVAENKAPQPLRGLDLAAKQAEEREKKAASAPTDDPVRPKAEKFGVFTCNLRSIEFTSLDEFEDAFQEFTRDSDAFAKQFEQMQKQLERQMQQFGGGFPGAFRQFGNINVMLGGSITWDDQRWEFANRQELDRARQQLRRHLEAAKEKEKKAKAAADKPKPKPAADRGKANPKGKPAAEKSTDKKAAARPWKEIDWQQNVADACQQAAGGPGPEDDKPVFVFRVLGDMNGFM